MILRSIFETSSISIVIADGEGTIIHANPAFERLSGYVRSTVEGTRKWASFLLNNDLSKMKDYQGFITDTGEISSPTRLFGFLDRDGLVHDVCVTKDTMASPSRTVISFVDITEILEERKARSESDARYRSLIESTEDSVYMVDRDCRYLFVNGRALKKLNGGMERIVGRFYGDLHGPEDAEEFAAAVNTVFESGVSHRYEYTARGNEHITLRTLSPIIDEDSRAVKFVTVVSKDITELKKTEEKLKRLSLHDALTGLYNRAYFEEEMHRLDNSRMELVGIIVCDIDGLKLVNDTLGHNKGDELLMAASRAIKSSFRESDVVARVGGDEFAILLVNSPKPKVEEICMRIRAAMAEHNRKNPALPLSIAIGYAVRHDPGQDMAELYSEADNKMYKEKLYSSQNARNAIVRNLISSVESKGIADPQAVRRFQDLTVALAQAVGLPEERVKDLRLLARFHDIGNISVHNRILSKSDALTDDELAEIRKHCDIGHRIAQSAPELVHISDFILKHHEWWNGEGYPLGLKGTQIPLESRIIAVADAYDAMTRGRPHKKAMTKEDALAELKKHAGTQFDPDLVRIFAEVAGP